jgi:beta-lactamase regulating signal transducer with metallopeptidase domain
MRAIESIFSPEMVEALGWTIVHSLWQGMLVLVGLLLILLLIRKYSAQIKYFITYTALIGILGWASITFYQSYQYAHEKQLLKEKISGTPGYVKSFLEESITKERSGPTGQESINLTHVKTRAFFQRNFYAICSFWLIGIVFLIIRFVGGLLYMKKIRRFQVVLLPEEWTLKIEEIATKLSIRRRVTAFFSPLAKIPMTLGVLKPVILFPVSVFTGLSAREIEAIIAHELAHILRNDYIFNIIQSVVEIIFFFHPAIWIIAAKIRKERENSCDNIAIQITGDKIALVKALASVQIHYWEEQQLAMAFAGKKNSVLQRIKRLQNNIVMKTNFIEGLIAAGVIVIGLALASFTNIENIRAKNMAVANSPDSVTLIKKEPVNPADIDSIRTAMENNLQEYRKNNESEEEFEKMVEVALSERDKELSAEMMKEINRSIQEMDISAIVREAMMEASTAMREASIEVSRAMREASIEVDGAMDEVDREEINHDLREAAREIEQAKREMAEEMRRDMAAEGLSNELIEASIAAATAGMNVAAGVVSSIDVEGIVSAALSGVEATLDALSQIDFDSSDQHHCYKNQEQEIEKRKKEKEKIKQEQKELKQRMKELEKELKKMEKE